MLHYFNHLPESKRNKKNINEENKNNNQNPTNKEENHERILSIWFSSKSGIGVNKFSHVSIYSIYVFSPELYALNQEGSIILEWTSTTSLSVIKI